MCLRFPSFVESLSAASCLPRDSQSQFFASLFWNWYSGIGHIFNIHYHHLFPWRRKNPEWNSEDCKYQANYHCPEHRSSADTQTIPVLQSSGCTQENGFAYMSNFKFRFVKRSENSSSLLSWLHIFSKHKATTSFQHWREITKTNLAGVTCRKLKGAASLSSHTDQDPSG